MSDGYIGRVGLISCGKEKLPHAAPAQDLYTGEYFRLCKQWMTKTIYPDDPRLARCDAWGILSAKYGLVLPDQVIEPYDVALAKMSSEERQYWQEWVHQQLKEQWGTNVIYLVLCGFDYRQAVKQMPYVEDVFDHWSNVRKEMGRRTPMGIGMIKRYLKKDVGYPETGGLL